jgi:RHS repeat-associated protein
MRAEALLAKPARAAWPARPLTSFAVFVLVSLLCGTAAAQMQANSSIRGGEDWTWWSPTYKPDAASCYSHCQVSGADACEWNQDGRCYVEFGASCSVQAGFPGWWAALVSDPPAPVLVSPAGNTYEATPVFSWNASSGALQYWVEVFDVSNPEVAVSVFRGLYPAAQVCSGSSCVLAPGKVLVAGPYQWNVEAQIGASKTWSAPKSFTVLRPPAPTLLSPNGSASPTPTFQWTAVPGATSYLLLVDRRLDDDTTVGVISSYVSAASVCSGTTCSYVPGTILSAGSSYTWQVGPMSAGGAGVYSAVWGFTVPRLPAPTLLSPSGSASPQPTFQWTAVPGAASYLLLVDRRVDDHTTVGVISSYVSAASVCSGTTCSYAPGTLLWIGSSYTWQVGPMDAGGAGVYSAVGGFTVAGPPTLTSPSGAIAQPNPTYTWQRVAEASQYFLAVDKMVDGEWQRGPQVLADASSVCTASTCATTAATLEPGQYRWWVEAKSGPGGAWGGPMEFSVGWTGATRCRGPFLAADFNGDGRTDQLCSQEGMTTVALSTGTGFASPTVWLEHEVGSPILGDYNGDGATDLAGYDAATFYVSLSTGTRFSPGGPWGTASALWNGQTYTCGSNGTAFPGSGNFDGNGYADVHCRGGDGSMAFVGKSNGSSFTFSVFSESLACWGLVGRAGPADFDGDGRDDWYCIDRWGTLTAMLSNGQAFEANTFQSPGARCEPDDYTFVDINGDGRTDVTCRQNGILLLSTGTAMLDTGPSGGWCMAWETIPDPEDPSKTIEVPRAQMQPMDVDGDRAPELVCTFDGPYVRDVYIRKWNGESLLPPQLLRSQWCSTSVQGGDFDGDGQFELVCDSGAVLRAGTPNVVPDLMVRAENGIGGKTTVGYQPSSVFGCNKPPVRQVATWTTTEDGRGGSSTTNYAYCGGRTDPAEGTFLGYGQAQTTLPCLNNEPSCPVTTTEFSQDLRTLGRPTLVRRAGGSGYVLQETRTFFKPQTGPSLPRQALVEEVRTTDFALEGGGTKTTAVSYLYDSYANVMRQTSRGEVTPGGVEIPNDELWTELTYWPADTSRYIVSLPRYRKVYEQRGSGAALLKSVETAYSPVGDLTSVKTSVLPGGGVLERTMTYEAGNLTYIKSELGAETTIVNTSDGLHPQTVTGPEGPVTTLWHSLCDTPFQVTDPNGVTTTGYDKLCRPERTDGPLGSFVDRDYGDEHLGDPTAQRIRIETPGSAGNDYSEQHFDGLGRTYRTVKRGPSPAQDILTERSYNSRGGLASETAPFYEGDPPDTTAYAYDSFDRVLTVTHADGTETTKSYGLWSETTTDPKRKAVTVQRTTKSSVETTTIEGELVTTTQSLDMLGRRIKLQDTKGNIWTWTYDSLDRIREQKDPDSGPRSFVYDDRLRTQTETDAEGNAVTLTFDTLGRLWSKTSAVGTSTFRYSESRGVYPNWGRLTTALSPGTTPGVTNTLTIDYDALGRLRRQERSIPEAGFLGAVTKGYDQVSGLLSTLVYPDGESIGPFGYDSAGRLTSIPGILQSVTYDAAGQPLEQRNANGTVTTRTYVEHRGVLDTLVTTHPTTGTIQSLDYGYDDDLPLVTSVQSPEPADRWTYGYDDGNRLSVVWNLTTPAWLQVLQYDSLDRITFNSRVGGDYVYEYPLPGAPQPHAPIRAGSATYEYWRNGNLKSGASRTPTWDAESRIAAIGTTRYSYDAFGERLIKTSPQGTSVYPFGDDYEITNGVTTKYLSVEGLGLIAKRVTGGPTPGLFWIHTDRLGSIHRLTNAAGVSKLGRSYRPYGETLAQAGSHVESRGWIDQRNDGETGLTYLHARYFDPKLGTFLSPDPIGVDGGMNAYWYGFGDPIDLADSSGLAPNPVFCYPWPQCNGGGGGSNYTGGYPAPPGTPWPYGSPPPGDDWGQTLKQIGCFFFGAGCHWSDNYSVMWGPNNALPQQGPPPWVNVPQGPPPGWVPPSVPSGGSGAGGGGGTDGGGGTAGGGGRSGPLVFSDPLYCAAQFCAGFGDSLWFGLPRIIREEWGIDDVIDYDGTAYAAGVYTEVGAEVVLTGVSYGLRGAAKGISQSAARAGARHGVKGVSVVHHRNALKSGLFPTAALPRAFRHSRFNTRLLGLAAHSREHAALIRHQGYLLALVNPGQTSLRIYQVGVWMSSQD